MLLVTGAVFYATAMPGEARPKASALTAEEAARETRLRKDLQVLAGEIGERNVTRRPEALAASEKWLSDELSAYGYTVSRQEWREGAVSVANVWAERVGTTHPTEQVVVGAHYDSAEGAPGADDNGSGTVAVLALARELAHDAPARTIRFVFFANEEPPYFWTEQMGSLR